MTGYKTYVTAVLSAACAVGAAYLGLIDWTTALQFVQAGALGAFIRNSIPAKP